MIKQVIVLRTDLNMRKGKMAAQAAHASMKVFLDRGMLIHETDKPATLQIWPITAEAEKWLKGAFTKIVVGCDSEAELLALKDKVDATDAIVYGAIIQDNGATEFHGVKTYTALAIGPADAAEIDKITGHLKLL